MDSKQIANKILLDIKDLNPYIYYRAKTGSIYIKFDDPQLRSIRIADHEGREKYSYKWNIRNDIVCNFQYNDKGVLRYYFGFHELPVFYEYLRSYYHTLKSDGFKKI